MMTRLATGGVLLALTGVMAYLMLHVTPTWQSDRDKPLYLTLVALAWLLVGVAILLLRRLGARWAAGFVLVGTLLVGATGLLHVPLTSTDSARYNWDGIVQKAGISPYAHVPAAGELTGLRTDWLFTAGHACGRAETGVGASESGELVCTIINRPLVPTIYPPVAEASFLLARLPFASSVGFLPTQLLGLLVALATTLLLLVGLRRQGRSPGWAALWGWSPFVALEAVNNAHIDVLAVCLALGGLLLLTRAGARTSHRVWGGILIGLGIATKFLPVLLLPPVLRRRALQLTLTIIGTVAAVYVPYVLVSGLGVLGYLPGYLNEEGYESGSRSVLLSLILPGEWATYAALAILVVIALLLLRRADPANPWVAQTIMVGSALLILSPRYGWYALLLLPFIVLSGRIEWLGVVLVLQLRQQYAPDFLFQTTLAIALAIVVVATLLRHLRARTRMGQENVDSRQALLVE
jgi:alpha-1,2-mannosyltransferase